MKFLTRERSKLGSAPGTIIQWSLPILDGDPDGSTNVVNLPAGYLKCDGSIYSERQYPELARILGVGDASIYKKSDTTLLEDQFQVPDLGSKHIEASVNANIGTYRNIQKFTSNATITKAGVGVEISSNVGNSAQVGFNGVFTVPSQNFNLNGNVGWTVPTNTEAETVPSKAIGPHMHYSSTSRVVVKEDPGTPHGAYANTSRPYYQSPADALTATPDCNPIATAYYQQQKGISEPSNCNSNCGTFGSHFIGTKTGSRGSSSSNWTVNKSITTRTEASWPNEVNVIIGNLRPYDVLSETGNFAYPICRNTEQPVEFPPGTDTVDLTEHSHRIEKDIGDTNFTATTTVETIRPDGLQATVNIRTDTDTKFDDIVSPYIVMEFLIKY